MEGLEATVILLSDFRVGNESLRLDSEYSDKAALRVINQLKSAGAEQFGDTSPEIIHPHEITRKYVEEDGAWFFRAQNLRPFLIEDDDKVFISDEDSVALARNELKNGDVVITRTGANAGDCALFSSQTRGFASSHTFIVRSKRWNHAFLVAYLNSFYGRCQILRARYGAAQPEVAPYYLRGIWIPPLSHAFQKAVESLFNRAVEKRNESKNLAQTAEQTLLQALGLKDWKPPEPLTYIRRASEAFSAARFDAEYFAPRVEQLLSKLSADGLAIQDVASVRHDSFDASKHRPESFNYIEISGLRSDGTATSDPTPTDEAPSRASQLVREGDIITSTVRPIRRLSAIIAQEQDLHVCSSGFVVLNPHSIAPEVLLTFLRLPIICELMDLHTSASLYPAISERDLLKLPIPRIADKTAQPIITQVRQAHAARQQAQVLLAKAKRAVEVAIEDGEEKAMKLIS